MIIIGGPKTPSTRSQINRAHPLARALKNCIIFGNGVPVDIALPLQLAPAGTLGWATSAGGPAFYPPQTGGNFALKPNGTALTAGDFSIRLIFSPVTWPGGFTSLIDTTSATRDPISVFIDTSGNVSFFQISGTSTGTLTTGMAAGQLWDFVLSRAGSTITGYVNSVSKGTMTNGGTSSSPTNQVFGENGSGSGSNPDVKYISYQSWLRALSQSEVRQLYADPYCFLLPESSNIILPVKGPVVVSAVLFRKTLSQIGGRVGSRQSQGWGS